MNLPQAFPAPRRLGAVALTPDLSSAATALVSALASGCPTTPFDACSSFQQKYVDAGGDWSNVGVTGTSPDGLYGPSTQAALQTVLDAIGQGQTAPNACVGPNTNVLALTPTTAPAVVPSGSIAIGPWVFSQQQLLVTAAVGIALALVGSAIYKHYADQEHLGTARTIRQPAYAHRARRRNPTRRRRVRQKARERSYEMVRDRKGRFVRRARASSAYEEE